MTLIKSIVAIALTIGTLSACGTSSQATIPACTAALQAGGANASTACADLTQADLATATQAALKGMLSTAFTPQAFCASMKTTDPAYAC